MNMMVAVPHPLLIRMPKSGEFRYQYDQGSTTLIFALTPYSATLVCVCDFPDPICWQNATNSWDVIP